jgi:hypothetical protein
MGLCATLPGVVNYEGYHGTWHQGISEVETFRGMRSGVAFRGGLSKRGLMKRFALLSVIVAFGLGACERHEFDGPDGTRQLHEHDASHDEHDSSGEEAAH